MQNLQNWQKQSKEIFQKKGACLEPLGGRGGENIIYCLLIKPKHTYLRTKKKKQAAYSGLIMEKKSILGLFLP